jgi:hypothetical protein
LRRYPSCDHNALRAEHHEPGREAFLVFVP